MLSSVVRWSECEKTGRLVLTVRMLWLLYMDWNGRLVAISFHMLLEIVSELIVSYVSVRLLGLL